jgi:hypothetical protein
MNATSPEFEDTPAYAAHWIIGYVLAAIIAFHLASLPGPVDSPATHDPSSWASR